MLRSLLSAAGVWCPSPGDEQELVVNLCEDASLEAGVAQAMPAPLFAFVPLLQRIWNKNHSPVLSIRCNLDEF